VLLDLLKVLRHAFAPEQYFARCADVAVRLNTIPNLFAGGRLFLRNVRTFLRLCWKATGTPALRRPFWRAVSRVVRKNPAGLEALATLSVLYIHFSDLLPYCEGQLQGQLAAIAERGEDLWLEDRLAEAVPQVLPPPQAAFPAAVSSARPRWT
jgi:hypothetical protein